MSRATAGAGADVTAEPGTAVTEKGSAPLATTPPTWIATQGCHVSAREKWRRSRRSRRPTPSCAQTRSPFAHRQARCWHADATSSYRASLRAASAGLRCYRHSVTASARCSKLAMMVCSIARGRHRERGALSCWQRPHPPATPASFGYNPPPTLLPTPVPTRRGLASSHTPRASASTRAFAWRSIGARARRVPAHALHSAARPAACTSSTDHPRAWFQCSLGRRSPHPALRWSAEVLLRWRMLSLCTVAGSRPRGMGGRFRSRGRREHALFRRG